MNHSNRSPRWGLASALGPWSHDIVGLLSGPGFRRLWLSTCASNFTLWTEMVITGWVALQLTGSPFLVALTSVGRAVAVPLIGPFGGALADRINRVLLVRISEWGNFLALLVLAGMLATGHGSYGLLLLATLWFGTSTALAWPARRTLIMDLAGSDRLLPAVGLDRVTQAVARIMGPLIAGTLLTLWGSGAYGVLLVFPCLSLLALGNLHPGHNLQELDTTPVWQQLRQGWTYVRRQPTIWAVLLISLAISCFLDPARHLYPVFAAEVLHAGPVTLGLMGAANGLGAPLMFLFLPRLRNARSYGWALVLGAMLGSLGLAAFAAATNLSVVIVLLLLSGLGQATFGVMQSTVILSRTEPSLRGRTMGLLVLSMGGLPVGALVAGTVAEHWNVPLAIGGGGRYLCRPDCRNSLVLSPTLAFPRQASVEQPFRVKLGCN